MRVQHLRSSKRLDGGSAIHATVINREKALYFDGLKHRLPGDGVEDAIVDSQCADIAHVPVNAAAIGRHDVQNVSAAVNDRLHCRHRHQHNCAETQAIRSPT